MAPWGCFALTYHILTCHDPLSLLRSGLAWLLLLCFALTCHGPIVLLRADLPYSDLPWHVALLRSYLSYSDLPWPSCPASL